MRRLPLLCLSLFVACAAAFPALAQERAPFEVSGFKHHAEGFDRVVSVTLRNTEETTERVTGRLIVISVYDTSPSENLPIVAMDIPSGEERTIELHWDEAPLLGQARTILVLQDRRGRIAVESFDFWIVPWQGILIIGGGLFVLAGLVMLTVRYLGAPKRSKDKKDGKKKKKRRKKKVPKGMSAYTAEFDDTVVRIADRFGVTWEDIVKANKLDPPYELEEGQEVLIPEHPIHRPHDS